ncbi:MAG: hydroxymethylglutaryl-CoA synthase [Palaeococcus sp.]|uniref:hydroxymethylglutaryl-CoA synthase n=1 Tax=Palaeococcus sp. (in: euryarchaeotes) TaxID=2820298 RepID=UPI0025E1077E|nr:hydroxymethylglutaryl-CoA synthase [Palaeococcus sp. (in: euryarchaeotes)]MCD6560043.1 hydroxymethylglutaryl-CoA synthase [Palaeococcus sp. (in: euryarchaeotes)]
MGKLLKPNKEVGIVGYGAYVPMYRIKAEEIGRVWGVNSFPIQEKSVNNLDEDAITIGIEAARNALKRAQIDPREIRALWFGTESKPYAVKPSATVIAEAIGATPDLDAADFEFACKAGTEALQASIGFVGSGMAKYAMAIGADTSQGRPGDHLEFTASAGGAAYIVGEKDSETLAYFEGSYSYVTDTPDFWRRQHEHYPRHGNRFTGEPAYFHQIISAAKGLMEELNYSPSDFDYAVFHQPNVKFPLTVAKILGIPKEKVLPGLLSGIIGNTYSGATLVGISAVLDIAKPGDRILWVSFGSGAGSDAFSLVVQDAIEEKRDLAPKTMDYVNRKKYIDYALYAKHRSKYIL